MSKSAFATFAAKDFAPEVVAALEGKGYALMGATVRPGSPLRWYKLVCAADRGLRVLTRADVLKLAGVA